MPDRFQPESALAARLTRLRTEGRSLVVWLDELDQHLRPGCIGEADFRALLTGEDVHVLATMRKERLAEITAAGGPAASVVRDARRISLPCVASVREK